MTRTSHLLPFFFALIVLLIPLISLVNNDLISIFTIKTFFCMASLSRKPNHSLNYSIPCKAPNDKQEGSNERDNNWRKAFIVFKTIDHNKPSPNISRAITPNISNCSPTNLPPHALYSSNCCPPIPYPFKFIDFASSKSNFPLRVRKPAHLVDEEFIAKFEKGIALMKALPIDDPRSFHQQAKVHCAYCNGAYHQPHPFQNLKINIHRSWLFFPFHRLYLYFFERILGNLIGDPNFALPFWNWDSPKGMQIPPYFINPNSSLYNKFRNIKHMPPHLVDLVYSKIDNPIPYDQQVSFNLVTMYKQMVFATTKELFMGMPLHVGDKPQPGAGSLELAPHNTLHIWMGDVETPNREDMGSFYSAARDPIFYPHHANMDRMWEVWKKLGEGRRDYNDDTDWLDSQFFFYDENANLVRVKVRDCIDTKKLGYVYQDVDLPWMNSPPKSTRTKLLREAKKGGDVLGSKLITKFPLVLDSIKTTIVKRPKNLRSEVEKEQEEEVLVIEGIEFGSDKFVKFDVHINDDEDNLSDPDQAEFVGSFVSLSHGGKGKVNTCFKVGISKVLENLEAEEDEDVVITLAPKVGKGEVIIGSIKIGFIPKY